MNKQKLSSLLQEVVEMAEELLEKQQSRDLTMFHVEKEVKTDIILKKAFSLLNKKYNSLLKQAKEACLISDEDSSFFSEVDEASFGDVLVEAALIVRYLKEEKSYKVINRFDSDEPHQIETEITELELDEDQLSAVEGKLGAMEQQLKKQNIEVKLKIRDHE